LYKKLLIGISLIFLGCGSGSNSNGKNNNSNNVTVPINNPTQTTDKYSYIPKEINQTIAIRFLNKASFGANDDSIKELQSKGILKWLDEQLNMEYDDNIYLKKMIVLAKQAEPDVFTNTVEEYLDENNDIVFNKSKASFQSPRYRMTSWFDVALNSPKQLRYKTAYALSQIIVESDFEPMFTRRAEALANYFDILAKNAFGNYQILLEDISFSSGMGLFLTYNGNKKEYLNDANVSVYPDENYAREIMQLFSIGLNQLNIDGTPKKDNNGNLIPTYTQTDVNEIARVFTGWDLRSNNKYGAVGFRRGDFTHNLEFTDKYHDFGEKLVLGEKVQANLSGEDDVKRVVSIIMKQPSVAPYISKNLIMRLTKSNPSPAYIQRVATVFRDTNGNLKEVIRAIFLDPELWDDLKNNKLEKFKEPIIAYTQFLRTFKTNPMPYYFFCFETPDENASNCNKVTNNYLFNDTRSYLNQGPGLAPTVFNFYDNSYIPNDEYFKQNNLVAPELQIQTDSMLINYSNNYYSTLLKREKNYILAQTYKIDDEEINYNKIEDFIKDSPKLDWRAIWIYYRGDDKYLLDMSDEYDVIQEVAGGSFDNIKYYKDENESILDTKISMALVNHLDYKLLGSQMSDEEKKYIVDKIVESGIIRSDYSHKAQVYQHLILPMIRYILTIDKYMTE